MLFTKKNNFKGSELSHLEIVSESEKMGVINSTDNFYVLPAIYDNIFVYGDNIFVVHKKGKIGAIRIESNNPLCIAECQYDTLDSFGDDLIFCNDKNVRYYNSTEKTICDFIDIVAELPFLYCKDEKYQYIFDTQQGDVIYKKEYTSYSESHFCFCGYTDSGPIFYDARYSTYIYPTSEGYKVYKELFISPIMFNNKNICNITEGDDGIGVVDPYGNAIMENKYDSITVELKITVCKGNNIEKKIIPFETFSFQKG